MARIVAGIFRSGLHLWSSLETTLTLSSDDVCENIFRNIVASVYRCQPLLQAPFASLSQEIARLLNLAFELSIQKPDVLK